MQSTTSSISSLLSTKTRLIAAALLLIAGQLAISFNVFAAGNGNVALYYSDTGFVTEASNLDTSTFPPIEQTETTRKVLFGVTASGDVYGLGGDDEFGFPATNQGILGTELVESDGETYEQAITSASAAIKIRGIDNVASLVSDGNVVLALKNDGTVWSWGQGLADGQSATIGAVNNAIMSAIPSQIAGLSAIEEIDLVSDKAIAVDATGNVWTWGERAANTGNNNFQDVITPQQVTGLTNIVSVEASASTFTALSSTGDVYEWNGKTSNIESLALAFPFIGTPTLVSGLGTITAIESTWQGHYALDDTGQLQFWGAEYDGIGINTAGVGNEEDESLSIPAWPKADGQSYTLTPKPVEELSNVTAIKAANDGSQTAVITTSNNEVFTWGRYSTAPDEQPVSNKLPVALPELSSALSLDPADSRIIVISSEVQTFFCNGLEATIIGTENDDILTGTSGVDVIVGLGGDDTINSLGGADVICGGEGEDTIKAGGGADVLFGGAGADIIIANAGNDTVNGDEGDDIIKGGNGVDTILGNQGDDVLKGGGGNDTIQGNEGIDVIKGGGGNDTISGNQGDDILQGRSGDDILNGNGGDNIVNGGADTDTCENGILIKNCEGIVD